MVAGERQERLARFLRSTRIYTCSSASSFAMWADQTQMVLHPKMAGVVEHAIHLGSFDMLTGLVQPNPLPRYCPYLS